MDGLGGPAICKAVSVISDPGPRRAIYACRVCGGPHRTTVASFLPNHDDLRLPDDSFLTSPREPFTRENMRFQHSLLNCDRERQGSEHNFECYPVICQARPVLIQATAGRTIVNVVRTFVSKLFL